MPKFILFVTGGYAKERDLSPEEIQQRIEKYRVWAGELAQQGKLVDANKITDEPHMLVRDNGIFTVQKPVVSEATVGGYFVIEAANTDEAVELSKACPIFEHGGSLEIRQIEG